MEWFEEWFDSPLYEMLYADRNETEAARLVSMIEQILPFREYPEVLDLGCGRGRHSLTLAERGYSVTGLDLSESAIQKAREKAQQRGLNRVTFLVGDMRQPLAQPFDAILNLFTSFGYFEDEAENLRVIAGVERMLRSDGLFFIDYMNAPKVRENFVPEDSGRFMDVHYTIRRFVHGDTIHKRIMFAGESSDGPGTYEERVKLYNLDWFREAFSRNGMEIVRTFGGYGGEAYDPDSSPRLIMVAGRPG